jgi:hypothetical protein
MNERSLNQKMTVHERVLMREKLWRSSKICFVCLRPIQSLSSATLEHVIPRSLGGTNSRWNLSLSHEACNSSRGSLLCRLYWHGKPIEIKPSKHDWVVPSLPHRWWDNFEFHRRYSHISHDLLDKVFSHEFKSFYVSDFAYEMDDSRGLVTILNQLRTCPDLIKASEKLESPGVRSHWKLLFGMVLLEKFFSTGDLEAFVHGIWRIDQFRSKKKDSILFEPLQRLLSYCEKIEPLAYEKYQRLLDLS